MQTNETEGQTATIDAPAKDATRLFVYGMLKRGYPLGDFISRYGATFVREAVLDDHTLRGGGIACMRPFAGGHVEGEVWDVPAGLMDDVDRIERRYDRRPVTLRDGETVDAYIARGDMLDQPEPGASSWPFTDECRWS